MCDVCTARQSWDKWRRTLSWWRRLLVPREAPRDYVNIFVESEK